MSNERMALEKAEAKASVTGKSVFRSKICDCEEKVKALAILMLHYCAGLQQVHEDEEIEKQSQSHVLTSSVLEDVEDDDEQEDGDDENSISTGLLSNLSASTACLIELDED